jgi:DNA-binding IclR family transcriptional regulator
VGRDADAVPIQSLSRAMRVLDQFTHGYSDLDLSELTRRTGMSRTTVHRYCLSLRELDLLRYDSRTALYSLGSRTIELGAIALQAHPLVGVADRLLRELMVDVERTLVITVWDGNAPLIVRVHDNTTSVVQISVRVGSRLSVFDSANGRAYLAFSERIHKQFEGKSELAAVEPVLEGIRQKGVSITKTSRGMTAASAPIGKDVVGTLATLTTDPQFEPDILEALKASAAVLAAELEA